MRIVFVVSEFLEHTREMLAVAAGSRNMVNLLSGDADDAQARPFLVNASRLWFEGVGELLRKLLACDSGFSGAALRVSEKQLPEVLSGRLWELVADLIVPSTSSAELVRKTCPPPPGRARLHVVTSQRRMELLGQAKPNAGLEQLLDIVNSQPASLPAWAWVDIAGAAGACRGDVLVMGSCPQEFGDYLRTCVGARAFANATDLPTGRADAVVLWNCLAGTDGVRRIIEAAGYLNESGALAAVAAGEKGQGLSAQATARLIQSCPCMSQWSIRFNGNTVLAMPPTREQAPCHVEQPRTAPLVSAIVTAYNEQKTIAKALASLRTQTYRNLEILVVDDGSTDDTPAIVEAQHACDSRVRLLRKPNGGIPDARNFGIRQARGQYIAWLDADDLAMPNRIAVQVEAVLANPKTDLVHSDALVFDHNDKLIECRRYRRLTDESMPWAILKGLSGYCPIMQPSQMVRKDLHDRVGLFDLAWPRSEDYEFYIRMAKAGGNTYSHIPAPLVAKFEDRHPRHSEAMLPATMESFFRVYRLLLSTFGRQKVCDQRRLELGDSPALCIAMELLNVAMIYRAPPGHALLLEIRQCLDEALECPDQHNRVIALSQIGALHRHLGDFEAAENFCHLAAERAKTNWEEALASEGLQRIRHARMGRLETSRQQEPAAEGSVQ